MVGRNVFCRICTIAETPSAEILLSNLKELFGEKAAEKLIDLAFKHSGNRQDIDVIVNDESRSYAVENRNGTLSYFQPDSAKWYPAPLDTLKIYTVNFDWLLSAVISALDIEGTKPHCVLEEKIWFIGSAWLKRKKTPVIFVRNINRQIVLEKLNDYLKQKHISQPALVLTTTSNVSAHFKPYGQSRIVMLNEAVDSESNRLAFNVGYLSDVMGGHIAKDGFSLGYRAAHFNGVHYEFTKGQAEIVEVLDKANGLLHKHELMSQTSLSQNDPKGVFRQKGKYHPAWGVIIKFDHKGHYWLER